MTFIAYRVSPIFVTSRTSFIMIKNFCNVCLVIGLYFLMLCYIWQFDGYVNIYLVVVCILMTMFHLLVAALGVPAQGDASGGGVRCS